MRRDARFYRGLQARGGSIVLFLLLATGFPSIAAPGDIAGRIEAPARPAKRGDPGFGAPGGWHADLAGLPAVVLLRSPEMVTTRRSGPRTFARRIVDGQVVPPFETLRLEDLVEVTNSDPEPRRLFVFAGAATRILGPIAPGEMTRFRLERFGPVEMYTDARGATRSLILVAENPFLAREGPDGRFLLDGVPPGVFDVLAFRPGRRSAPARAVVDFEGVVAVTLRLR